MRALSFVIMAACAKATPAASPSLAKAPAYPLLDGRCDEYAALAAKRHDVVSGVELFVFQDRSYVWLCYTLPPDTFGALDMVISAPGLDEPMTLHASAQLGEWPASDPEAMPKTAASDRWWNQHGWTALPVPFNGTDGAGKPKFRPTAGRELQLGKSRFGHGTWRLRLTIYGVAAAGLDARYPTTGDLLLAVW